MLQRQRIIVSLMQGHRAAGSRLGLVKLSFLLRQESPSGGGRSFYEFVPYRFGPYSFTLNHELQHLSRDGLVDFQDHHRIAVRKSVGAVLDRLPLRLEQDVNWILKEYADLSVSDLLEYVYRAYPWFTINNSESDRDRPTATLAIYTAGYEKQPIDRFLDQLLRTGIQRIIDVRNNPISRRYGFHKSTMRKISHSLGFEYFHLPNLGIPAQHRSSAELGNDLQSLFANYRDKILPAHPDDILQLSRLVSEKPSVLVCMEADPAQCHRSHLAAELEDSLDFDVVHLGWPR
jgi:hypothetical protein